MEWRCSAFSQIALLCKCRPWDPCLSLIERLLSLDIWLSPKSVCLVSSHKVCFHSSICPMISLLAWSNNCLCILTVHLLSLHYLFHSTLNFMQFWGNPSWWFKGAFVLDAVEEITDTSCVCFYMGKWYVWMPSQKVFIMPLVL